MIAIFTSRVHIRRVCASLRNLEYPLTRGPTRTEFKGIHAQTVSSHEGIGPLIGIQAERGLGEHTREQKGAAGLSEGGGA